MIQLLYFTSHWGSIRCRKTFLPQLHTGFQAALNTDRCQRYYLLWLHIPQWQPRADREYRHTPYNFRFPHGILHQTFPGSWSIALSYEPFFTLLQKHYKLYFHSFSFIRISLYFCNIWWILYMYFQIFLKKFRHPSTKVWPDILFYREAINFRKRVSNIMWSYNLRYSCVDSSGI